MINTLKRISTVGLFLLFTVSLAFAQKFKCTPFADGIFSHNSGKFKGFYHDTIDQRLYVYGGFQSDTNTGIFCNGIMYYDEVEQTWHGMNGGLLRQNDHPVLINIDRINKVLRFQDELYACGYFDTIGHKAMSALVKWNGSDWEQVPIKNKNSTPQGFTDMVVFQDTLYVIGGVDSVGGVYSHGVAKFDGQNWHVVDPDYFAQSNGLNTGCVYNNELYVGGNTNLYQDRGDEVYRLTDTGWTTLNGGIFGDSWVNTLEVGNDHLLIGGHFYKGSQGQGNASDHFVTWNGKACEELAPGLNVQVWDIAEHENRIWAAGPILGEDPNGNERFGIAYWDSCNLGWNAPGCDFPNGNEGKVVASYGEKIIYAPEVSYLDYPGAFVLIEEVIEDTCKKQTADENPSSIRNLSAYERIAVYPNPTTSKINIDHPEVYGTTYVRVINTMGAVVLNESYDQLRLDHLDTGLYYLEVQLENKILYDQLIVE